MLPQSWCPSAPLEKELSATSFGLILFLIHIFIWLSSLQNKMSKWCHNDCFILKFNECWDLNILEGQRKIDLLYKWSGDLGQYLQAPAIQIYKTDIQNCLLMSFHILEGIVYPLKEKVQDGWETKWEKKEISPPLVN